MKKQKLELFTDTEIAKAIDTISALQKDFNAVINTHNALIDLLEGDIPTSVVMISKEELTELIILGIETKIKIQARKAEVTARSLRSLGVEITMPIIQ